MVKVPQDSPKILIVQLRRIGDVAFTLPVIGALRRAFRNPTIDFLVEPPADALVSLDKNVRRTLSYDARRPLEWIRRVRSERYDAVLDFHSNGRTLWITALSGARVRAGFAGALNRRLAYNVIVPAVPNRFIVDQKIDLVRAVAPVADVDWNWKWDLTLPPAEISRAEKLLAGFGSGKTWIGFAPLHRHPIRAWHRERFAAAGDQLIKKGFGVLLLGGPGEKNGLDAVRKLMRENAAVHEASNLLELSALISRCRGFLANDNGPQKIAMALNVPSVTIFGPTNPLTINPNRKPHASIRDESLFCIGCEKKICPYRHECMTNITVGAVVEKLEGVLR